MIDVEPTERRIGRVRSLRAAVDSRAGRLLAARVVEQGSLGLVSLVLARWLGIEAYAPVAALVVWNSFAIVASDLGIGTVIMSGRGRAAGLDQVRRVRVVNAVVAAVAIGSSSMFDGSVAAALPWVGALWLASGEAFIRKSALLRLGREGRVALSEIVASVVFVGVASTIAVAADRAVVLVGAALTAKHVIEIIAAGGWQEGLAEHGTGRAGSVWWTQVTAYATANVDFVVVGLVVSAGAFSVYSLGFRIAALVTSQVAYAFGRLVLVDLGRAEDRPARQRVYDSRIRLLFGVGVLAAALAVAAAAVLPMALGSQWADSAWVVVILAIAAPWRMVLGVTGALMVAGDRAATLVRWEVGRLAATAAVLLLAAQGGLWPFTGAVAAVAIAATALYNRLATAATGLDEWRVPRFLALPGVALAALAAMAVSWS